MAPTPLFLPPSVQDIEAVSELESPVLRNLRITQHYHNLAVSFAQAFTHDSRGGAGANWCTFAVWASRQAGQTVRGEDVLDTIALRLRRESRLIACTGRLWRRVFVHAIDQPATKRSCCLRIMLRGPLVRASDAVARGNRKVYEEIAREFARFLAVCEGGHIDEVALQTFLAGLKPGEPPGGQDYLKQAFTHYAAAFTTTDPVARAELMLLANLLVGLHEQTRLQPEILEALEVPFGRIRELGGRLLAVLRPGCEHWHWAVRTPAAILVGASARAVGLSLRGATRRLITERMMTLTLPDSLIHLGRDLRGDYPALLREPARAELVAMLGRYPANEGAGGGVGADDWSELHERMRLIARLFRVRQEDALLFRGPFSVDQVLALEAGRVPEGDL